MSAAVLVGALVTAGVFLILQRGLFRVIIAFILLSHAVNVLLLAAGGLGRREPPYGVGDPQRTADPLPQAFALTAIVITFGITIYLLGLFRVSADEDPTETGPDQPGRRPEGTGDPDRMDRTTQVDPTDRRQAGRS